MYDWVQNTLQPNEKAKWSGTHQKFTFLEEEKEAAELEQVGDGVGVVSFPLSIWSHS